MHGTIISHWYQPLVPWALRGSNPVLVLYQHATSIIGCYLRKKRSIWLPGLNLSTVLHGFIKTRNGYSGLSSSPAAAPGVSLGAVKCFCDLTLLGLVRPTVLDDGGVSGIDSCARAV